MVRELDKVVKYFTATFLVRQGLDLYGVFDELDHFQAGLAEELAFLLELDHGDTRGVFLWMLAELLKL